jgi:alginate O-acetyltransferase complex protein AlgI
LVFSSYVFLFGFLPVVLAGYYGLQLAGALGPRRALPYLRLGLLLVASYVFYGWERYDFLTLLVGSSLVDFFCGWGMGTTGSARARRLFLWASLVANLGLLGFFKYRNLFIGTISQIAQATGLEGFAPLLPGLALPMGISFFTFQSMSYTIDVYEGRVKPLRGRHALVFLTYVAMFPQLVAGPIVRFRDVADQLVHRVHSTDKVTAGAFLFMLGFAKKTLLANPVSTLADSLFHTVAPGLLDAWCGMLSYAAQIYFDFSGYSDMAIGLGLVFGFVFPANFDSPYRSESITEFWRRWHISLSTWLRDYLYLPLGGNRRGRGRTYVNLTLVMLLGGLWHGAAWTFVLWGGFHGLLLAFERARGRRTLYASLPRWGRIGATFLLVTIGWTIFRAESVRQLGDVLAGLGGLHGLGELTLRGPHPVRWPLAMLTLGLALAFFAKNSQTLAMRITWPAALGAVVAFCLGVAQMLLQGFNPFIYFQF